MYDYDSSGSMADALSRVASVVDDDGSSTHLADYSYLGLRTFVETDYTEPDVEYTLGTAGGNDSDTETSTTVWTASDASTTATGTTTDHPPMWIASSMVMTAPAAGCGGKRGGSIAEQRVR
ncbi:MAG: hypothetical protein R3C59_23210 [Planctomycetaceae bacterium]